MSLPHLAFEEVAPYRAISWKRLWFLPFIHTESTMKLVTFLLLALFTPSIALSQIPWPLPECVESPPLRALPKPVPRPIGTPLQLKGSCPAVYELNEYGLAVAFWCKQAPPKPPVLHLYAVRTEFVQSHPELLVDIAMLGLPGADNRDRIQQLQSKYQTVHVLDMCEVWEPMRSRIDAARPK